MLKIENRLTKNIDKETYMWGLLSYKKVRYHPFCIQYCHHPNLDTTMLFSRQN